MNKLILSIQFFGLLVGAFAAPSFLYGDGINSKVVGGKDAAPGQFPFIVSIRVFNSHSCGGSIINEEWILTAAHCLVGASASLLSVVAGSNLLSSGGVTREVSKIIYNKDFSFTTTQNDIGLIKLAEPLSFDENIKPIPTQDGDVAVGSEATLIGWGLTSYPGSIPNNLQFIDLKTISTSACKEYHGEQVTDKQVCTLTEKGEGACQGDSGGPLISNGKLTGLVSWGLPCAQGYPDVFTRVSAFKDWIDTNMQ